MSTDAYRQIVAASPGDRLDLFLATANRIGAPVGNVEKDFWVCWTLNSLYHERPAGEPRLLFKGGTSLSKGYGLIQRFSEDIDVTVFRDDLDAAASVEELEALSNKKRRSKLDGIRDACRAYITGPLRDFLTAQLADITNGAGRVELEKPMPMVRPCCSGIPRSSRVMAPMCDRPYALSPGRNRRSIPIAPSRSRPMSRRKRQALISPSPT